MPERLGSQAVGFVVDHRHRGPVELTVGRTLVSSERIKMTIRVSRLRQTWSPGTSTQWSKFISLCPEI